MLQLTSRFLAYALQHLEYDMRPIADAVLEAKQHFVPIGVLTRYNNSFEWKRKCECQLSWHFNAWLLRDVLMHYAMGPWERERKWKYLVLVPQTY